MERDTAFELASSSIRFGQGVTREAGMDLADMGIGRVMVVTDPVVSKLSPVATAIESLESEGISYELYDRVGVEPTDISFKDAIKFATEGEFEGFVAIGGGSSMDTAKAANLYSTYPADFFDYLNAPIGKGKPVPGQLKPLIAIPTTSGTGSETTGVAIFDLVEMKTKTGISHRRMKPTLGLLDPDNTKTLPLQVAAATGLDVLSHALESYTAIPFNERPRPERPLLRPSYQGSNPISDLWALEALRMVKEFLVRAVEDPSDDKARSMMLLAASYAGLGFGNAGCHLPHGMSYPVSGMVKEFKMPGYAVDYPIIPHGVSVILNAPAVFRFTASACPERHLHAAEVLGANISGAKPEDAGRVLSDLIISYMQRLNIPNGIEGVGYTSDDVSALVKGASPQHRVNKLSPRPVEDEDLADLFQDALRYW